jgi:AcrR family transcriptional regulator
MCRHAAYARAAPRRYPLSAARPCLSGALSGRRAHAAADDERIREAARDVFVADPGARAGVGISALYRRYPRKDHPVRTIAGEGAGTLHRGARALEGDPGDSFAAFMARVVDADLHSMHRFKCVFSAMSRAGGRG